MGQEISQQTNKCSNIIRRQQQTNSSLHDPYKQNYKITNEKYTKHKDINYTSSSISGSSSTDEDDNYRQRQKYDLRNQVYEKTKIAKKYSLSSSTYSTSGDSTEDTKSIDNKYQKLDQHKQLQGRYKGLNQHHRSSSQSTDSGIYYSSCHCSSQSSSSYSSASSAASTSSGCATSVVSSKSSKSLDKQKHYLNHHLYIKSYLDILEEDQKARAHFQAARPGGIRNYTPKILAAASEQNKEKYSLSASAPNSLGLDIRLHQRNSSSSSNYSGSSANIKEDPWI